jgi:hypothetical protein
VVVDSQGRPVISGGYVKEFGDCSGSSQAISVGFVGRLTNSGALDTTFGEGGLRQVTDLASFPQVGFTPTGGLTGGRQRRRVVRRPRSRPDAGARRDGR